MRAIRYLAACTLALASLSASLNLVPTASARSHPIETSIDPQSEAIRAERHLVNIGLIGSERARPDVADDFASRTLTYARRELEALYAQADAAGEGALVRAIAEASARRIVESRRETPELAPFPDPVRVRTDVAARARDRNDEPAVRGAQAGRLEFLGMFVSQVVEGGGGARSPPDAIRLQYLYRLHEADIEERADQAWPWTCREYVVCPRRRYEHFVALFRQSPAALDELARLYFPRDMTPMIARYAAPVAQEEIGARTWAGDAVSFILTGLAALAAVAALGFAAWFLRKGKQTRPVTTNYGSAHFAPDIERMDPKDPLRGVFFGKQTQEGKPAKVEGVPVFSAPKGHTLILAPTRTGKGTRIIIPTLLRCASSMVVIDPKGENAAVTARARQAWGHHVVILNPWGALEDDLKERGFAAAAFNPLDVIVHDDPGAVSIAHAMAEAICARTGDPKNQFWEGSAASILTAVLLWLADQPGETKTLARARTIVTSPRHMLERDYFPKMAASSAYGGAIAEYIGPFVGEGSKELPSILSTLGEATRFISDPKLKAATGRSDVNLHQLTQEPVTIYLVIPMEQMKTQSPWLKLILSAVAETYRKATDRKGRCMLLVDELIRLGRLPDLPNDLATMSGFGLDYTLVVQDLGQLKAIYGDATQTILGNCAWKWFCNVSDLEGAKTLSEALGDKTVGTVQQSEGTTTSDKSGSATSGMSYGEMGRRLRTPDELMSLGKDTAFLFTPDSRPVLLRPIDYWQIRQEFDWLAEGVLRLYFSAPYEYDDNPRHLD